MYLTGVIGMMITNLTVEKRNIICASARTFTGNPFTKRSENRAPHTILDLTSSLSAQPWPRILCDVSRMFVKVNDNTKVEIGKTTYNKHVYNSIASHIRSIYYFISIYDELPIATTSSIKLNFEYRFILFPSYLCST